MTRWLSVLLLAFLVLPVSATTPSARPEELGFSPDRLKRITELVQRHIDARSFSGAVTLVARQGRIGHFEAQGLMDIESKRPMQKDTIFQIMSMTKPVVGVSILMMMEEGKIRLTDPVSRFIPEFKQLQVAVPQPAPAGMRVTDGGPPRFYAVPADREITIRDLLSHTSGLMSGTISNYTARGPAAVHAREQLADVVPRLARTTLEFQPGTHWAYSATGGFDTLARVVEITSGLPFDQFVKQRIFEPLGMKDTFFYPAEGNPRMVSIYSRTPEGQLAKRGNVDFMNGAYFSGGGGLFSTAEDYLQFGLMLMQGGQHNGKRLLAPRSIEMMATIAAPDTLPGRTKGEGFGLSVRVVNDPMSRGTFLSEGTFGWSGAWGTHFWVDRKERVVAIALIQTPNNEFRSDFENAVMQSIVGPGVSTGSQ
ncbi:MAG: serine hydrolase domain-containing protein [Vicinamibacterales bacterium]